MGYLQRFSPRELLIACGLSWFLAAVAIGIYGVKPSFDTYAEHYAQRALLRNVASGTGNLAAEIVRLETATSRLQHSLYGALADVPKDQVEAFIVGELQRISWRHDINLIGLTPVEDEPVEDFEALRFDVKLRAGYFDLAEWFHRIQSELGFIAVRRFDITRAGLSDDGAPLLNVDTSLVSFRAR